MSQISTPTTAKRIDPRVTRTQLALREALVSLIREKGFEAVTVQDITKRAAVNRATFYLHYADKFDLVNQNMKAMLDELVSEINTIHAKPSGHHDDGVGRVMEKFFEQINTYRSFYSSLMGQEGVPALAQQLRTYMEHIIDQFLQLRAGHLPLGSAPLPIRARFTAAAYLGVVEWWLEHKQPYTPQEMARWMWQLTTQNPFN